MIDQFWQSTASLLTIIVFGAGVSLVAVAALSVLRERRAEDKVVAGIFAVLILILVVAGIQEYPAVLQEAGIEGLRKTNTNAAAFRAEWEALLSGITDPWTGETSSPDTAVTVHPDPNAGGGAPPPVPTQETVIIVPPMTYTPAVPPTPLPTAMALPEGTPDPSATPAFILPTPTLAPTAVPTLDMSLWNPQTPAPTPLAGGS